MFRTDPSLSSSSPSSARSFDLSSFTLDRRRFLGGVAALGAGAVLAACSSGGSGQPLGAVSTLPSALQGGTPKRGGTFTVGMGGSGSAETLYGGNAAVSVDYLRSYSLYNLLFYPATKVTPLQPGLALNATANADSTVWTLELRKDVLWHNGKPFEASDVVYNIQSLWTDPSKNLGAAFLTGLIDLPNVRALDTNTVQIPLTRAVGQLPSLFAYVNFAVLPAGSTPESVAAQPIGTGPFRYVSFTPGRESVFDANRDYWEEGKPYVDRLVVQSGFSDPTAVVNALEAGQINLASSVDPVSARQQATSNRFQVIQSELAANVALISMRVDEGPFADVRVRQAMKLLCNRQALIDGALSGFGTPGNDLISVGSEFFAGDITSEYDPDRAKSLLQQAGADGQAFSLQTFSGGGPWDPAATLFAQQAQAAGVDVQADVTSSDTYFTAAGGVYTGYFRQNFSGPIATSLTASYRLFLSKNAPFQDTHWAQQPGGDKYESLLDQAISASDAGLAAELWKEVQQVQHDEGGYIGWANMPYVDAAANNVRGLSAGSATSFNNYRLCDGWVE
ncbi:ABC transporter substrate-binding protein [Rhodococcus sovatensis]|uniref:ABC transporter substrate-binding protein n=1 Tax=Rhodococcus sovatensis TaxID=1805840 RepID=A0ABZ2PI22_9NOCA